MSNWWDGKALDQSTHERINAEHYPGTRELCCECDEPTGKAGAGEDSLFTEDGGPYCEDCWPKALVSAIELPCHMEPDDGRILDANENAVPESHIVHCVNNHERLVAQLEELKEFMEVELTGTAWADCRHMAHSIGKLLAALEAGKGGE